MLHFRITRARYILQLLTRYHSVPTHNFSQAGARRFPALVPITNTMAGVGSSAASFAFLQSLHPGDIRVFICVGASDPVLGPHVMESGVLPAFESSTGALMMTIPEAGHFVQEWGEPVAEKAIDAWAWERDEDAVRHLEGVTLRRKAKVDQAKGKL